ncbi:MAG: serine/threonine-protein kinase [Pirellulaceae bacterium]
MTFGTTNFEENATITLRGSRTDDMPKNELTRHYLALRDEQRFRWTTHHSLSKLLGQGGQGVVFLTERRGTDGFTLPIALKIFSPERYRDVSSYEDAMCRIATVAAQVAQIQHDHLIDVHNFVDRNRIRMMVMEWIDGYDLRRLLSNERLETLQKSIPAHRWEFIRSVVVTKGKVQSRLKAGVAVAIVRDCLSALDALHRDGIVHSDVKLANVMLNFTGSAKIIDIGSAFKIAEPPTQRSCTPQYAAPEVLQGSECTPQSDLASLGYVLVELLAGIPCFSSTLSFPDLLEAKRVLPRRLAEILPDEVSVNPLLMQFCRKLIEPDPNKRFPTAEAANVREEGAAAIHRQLIMGNMASEYPIDIRTWLEELRAIERLGGDHEADDSSTTNTM